jgi:hypothetical protein
MSGWRQLRPEQKSGKEPGPARPEGAPIDPGW